MDAMRTCPFQPHKAIKRDQQGDSPSSLGVLSAVHLVSFAGTVDSSTETPPPAHPHPKEDTLQQP